MIVVIFVTLSTVAIMMMMMMMKMMMMVMMMMEEITSTTCQQWSGQEPLSSALRLTLVHRNSIWKPTAESEEKAQGSRTCRKKKTRTPDLMNPMDLPSLQLVGNPSWPRTQHTHTHTYSVVYIVTHISRHETPTPRVACLGCLNTQCSSWAMYSKLV
jgi:hypothetical protein